MNRTENTAENEAKAMLDTFASVGAETFDLTLTDLHGNKTGFRKAVPLAKLSTDLPALLDTSTRNQHNVILRPHGPGVQFIQLDDLTPARIDRLQPVSFLQLETSPGNYQAWIALSTRPGADFARRLRKGAGADPSASGATRVAGSLNFKDKYAPDYPRVRIADSAPGRLTSPEELTALGLVAAPEIAPAKPIRVSRARPDPENRKWPSYAISLRGAPTNHSGTAPDTSRADFVFAMTCITWGWSIEQTAERLMLESGKAQENGERYALLTAQNAAAAVERRKGQNRA